MNRTTQYGILCLILGMLILAAGCSKYADPELDITSNITKISEEQATGNITYDVEVLVKNTGQNNAYKVKVLAILSTPKELPEYRFASQTLDIGDVPKGEQVIQTKRMVLPATKSNYDLILSGSQKPQIETKLTAVTSNVMG